MKRLILAALLVAAFASQALAYGSVSVGTPNMGISVNVGTPPPVYVAPAPTYVPAPVYVAPAPTYVPAPVYVAPAPAYVPAPPVVYYRPKHHHHPHYGPYYGPYYGYR